VPVQDLAPKRGDFHREPVLASGAFEEGRMVEKRELNHLKGEGEKKKEEKKLKKPQTVGRDPPWFGDY